MEFPDYSSAKRYSDVMKTMWFTFFYAPILPAGVLFSLLGLTIYFWVDKFNLLTRRTPKEAISKDLTIEMIELLEMAVVFYGAGNFYFYYNLFNRFSWQSIAILAGSLIYAILPMQMINEILFPIHGRDEIQKYQEAHPYFDTDYDRENPVYKADALKEWQEIRKNI